MIKKRFVFIFLILGISLFGASNFQMEDEVKKVNEEIAKLKNDLKEKMSQVETLYNKKALEPEYKSIFEEIKKIKENIKTLEEEFRKDTINESIKLDEGYAFWDQGETTISQLVMEFGSQDYLYIIPPDLASIKLNMFSTVAIPRQSWEELLEFILTHNGIGIKKINPFLRELYVMKQDPSYIDAIVSTPEDLSRINDSAVICYIFSPPVEQLRSLQGFLERFCDIKQITIHPIKTNIIVVGSKETISRLINLYDVVFKNAEGKVIKVVSLSKINPTEADKILQAFFSQNQKTRPSYYQGAFEDLNIIIQDSSLILIGEFSLVEKAENVITDLEKQLDDPSEMTIFWYTCKNSDPQDLADILEKIYVPMSGVQIDDRLKTEVPSDTNKFNDPSKYNQSIPIKSKLLQPGKVYPFNENKTSSSNFVVDAKTGSLLMVVRKDELPKLKALLKKLDEPKKMVQIDVLLVERKIQDRKQTGINLLKIGNASNKNETKVDFDSGSTSERKGILDFILSLPKGKLPAFDLTLSFLMAQDDMRIADCPSIIAVNQTPATISVEDEISINNGAVQSDSSKIFEKSFTRARFGTKIIMTPIIHLSDDDNESTDGYVTLHTDVSFDTTKSKDNDKPAVTRRHIENEVRVADGQTIILGGLRRKTGEEGTEKIPFLGEIPGIGKLFGTTSQSNSSSEMFIFITPHIIKDPKIDLEKQKNISLQKRQGDIDEFIQKLDEAKNHEKQKLFNESIKLFFDK